MNCSDVRTLVHPYMDGELDLVKSLDIERHLGECSSCAQALDKLQSLRTAITGGSLYHEAPALLRERLRTTLPDASKSRRTLQALPRRWLALAAALLLGLLAGWGLTRLSSSPSLEDPPIAEVVSSHVRSLLANHLTDVASSDQHTVKPWFTGKVNFSPPVKDLANQGFPLLGGRLDYLDKKPVAALIFQHRKHFINLFVWSSPDQADTDTHRVTRQTYHLIHWIQSGLTYWAVSDLNSEDLEHFVRAVQESAVVP